MTKDEFIENVIERVSLTSGKKLTKQDTALIIDAVFDTVLAGVKQNGTVSWPKFGTFKLTKSTVRVWRNPKTNATVDIPATKNVSFKLKPALKNSL